MKKINFDKETGERVDRFLAESFPEYSRSYFERLIKDNKVLVNERPIKQSFVLKKGDLIAIDFVEKPQVNIAAQKIELNIIYEDENVIVINKPAGMVVHPAAGHHDSTLVNALLGHFPKISEAVFDKGKEVSASRPGLVHRLDKDTSGVMIVAKNARALKSLSKQIQNRTVQKVYLGLCYGWPKTEVGELVSFLGRSPKNRKKMAEVSQEKGRKAITDYKVLKYYTFKEEKLSLIEFDIKTGRTHQIRVQISKMGHPIMGDLEYGNKLSGKLSENLSISRQMLHAADLKISLPGESQQKVYKAPMPEDLQAILSKLQPES